MNELTITNYDNFKDLSFFVDEHEKAMKILENVNNFYLSFLKSNLLYCRDIDKYPGNILKQSFIDNIDSFINLYNINLFIHYQFRTKIIFNIHK